MMKIICLSGNAGVDDETHFPMNEMRLLMSSIQI
jgi:hypothetical protein